MKLPIVYPLTRPNSHSTSRITAIVNSIVPLLGLSLSTSHAARNSLIPLENGCAMGCCVASPSTTRCIGLAFRLTSSLEQPVMNRLKYFLALLVIVLLLATSGGIAQTTAAPPPPAQGIDASLLSGLRWRSIGPARGGRSQAVAGSAKRPMEYYFGATGGGVWKTTDGGVNWRPVSDRFFKSSSVGAIAVSESNPDIVYAGMGETQLRGNIIQG